MSTANNLRRPISDYFNTAQWLVAELEDFLLPGQTMAQNPAAFEALSIAAISIQACGGSGWVFVFEDHSAVMTSNEADYIWPRWVA